MVSLPMQIYICMAPCMPFKKATYSRMMGFANGIQGARHTMLHTFAIEPKEERKSEK